MLILKTSFILSLTQNEGPYGITVFENYLYVSSWQTNSIQRISRFQFNQLEDIVLLKTANSKPLSIFAYHRQRQPQGKFIYYEDRLN